MQFVSSPMWGKEKSASNLIPPEPNSVTDLTAPLKQKELCWQLFRKIGI